MKSKQKSARELFVELEAKPVKTDYSDKDRVRMNKEFAEYVEKGIRRAKSATRKSALTASKIIITD